MPTENLGELYKPAIVAFTSYAYFSHLLSRSPMIHPSFLDMRDPYQWSDLEIVGWAVAGFFAISGWLPTGSRTNLDFASFT